MTIDQTDLGPCRICGLSQRRTRRGSFVVCERGHSFQQHTKRKRGGPSRNERRQRQGRPMTGPELDQYLGLV